MLFPAFITTSTRSQPLLPSSSSLVLNVSGLNMVSNCRLTTTQPSQPARLKSIKTWPLCACLGSMNFATTRCDFSHCRKASMPCIGFNSLDTACAAVWCSTTSSGHSSTASNSTTHPRDCNACSESTERLSLAAFSLCICHSSCKASKRRIRIGSLVSHSLNSFRAERCFSTRIRFLYATASNIASKITSAYPIKMTSSTRLRRDFLTRYGTMLGFRQYRMVFITSSYCTFSEREMLFELGKRRWNMDILFSSARFN
mmetsp:Transcript_30350/g.71906  ORF Transcript_30350/g.71906 Transcript_30350/m.71906 type:complete len:257 (+) Transcript_30350:429-1199(+)